jgi:SlyX protein
MEDSGTERIELKIAFLESAFQELSDVVYRQQREIEALQAQLALSQRQLEEIKADRVAPRPEDERPPHY